jgi:hypothetical protein
MRLIFGMVGQPIRHVSLFDYTPEQVGPTWEPGVTRQATCGVNVTQPNPGHQSNVSWERIHEPTYSFIHDQFTGYLGKPPPWKLCLDCVLAMIR